MLHILCQKTYHRFQLIDDRLHKLNVDAEKKSDVDVPKLPRELPVIKLCISVCLDVSVDMRQNMLLSLSPRRK